ncbi:MAG: hypothetical protein WDN03_10125 [Rhizomicrobium sp.]
MGASEDFKLSRIYAQGWAAAGKLTDAQSAALEAGAVPDINPYKIESERARWSEGFEKALSASGTLPFRKTARLPKAPQ